LVMDAFSSDSVPTHLLTKEALALYFKKLKPNGILAFHITNRHLALKKVLSIHAEQARYAALIQEFKAPENMPLVVDTDWVVMAKQPETLEPLNVSLLGSWQKMPLYFDKLRLFRFLKPERSMLSVALSSGCFISIGNRNHALLRQLIYKSFDIVSSRCFVFIFKIIGLKNSSLCQQCP
ncbi:MAG: hypothetical protein LUO95_12190, partial [Methylococcaceae bacterium]|nr:hypothetical protein [Methylococcaceae bacterium]